MPPSTRPRARPRNPASSTRRPMPARRHHQTRTTETTTMNTDRINRLSETDGTRAAREAALAEKEVRRLLDEAERWIYRADMMLVDEEGSHAVPSPPMQGGMQR